MSIGYWLKSCFAATNLQTNSKYANVFNDLLKIKKLFLTYKEKKAWINDGLSLSLP
jgi:hypothetical protein